MELLGHFQYHTYEIKLEGSEDERAYKVTCISRSLKEIRDGGSGDVEEHPFDDLRPARDAFECAVHNAMMMTSFTDVSIFQQQTNGLQKH